ncbi:MAG: YhgN family NAAT transporter [Calditrichia bacterium]|nr:YhgN family NAAT transporter [Calditrichota bacterium]MCB0266844.1 YhgN family NAAT transporter [Calditrichota bacterium]MCB0287254.1 YhgN family NAAT transporter [Calditrichota bacterium]MCB9066569.1 YhgN family NAAT transporter [Calditrichia bacterium]
MIDSGILSSAVVLFLVMDPLGNVPLFLSLLKDFEPKRRRIIILRELVIALAILLIFLYFGQNLLNFLQLEQESVSIAGGIVLFIIAIRMIFPSRHGIMGESLEGEPFIVPLAIPLIAGPSALATLILMVRSDPTRMTDWLFALMMAWGITAVILLAAPLFYKLLRRRGLAAVERLMGMLLIMISVQMLLNGIKVYLQFLKIS